MSISATLRKPDPPASSVATVPARAPSASPAQAVFYFLSVLGVLFLAYIAVQNKAGRGVDYNQFYSAARLTGTGHLYDWAALQKLESPRGEPTPTGRLPIVLFGHKLLTALPYTSAQLCWALLGIAALIGFIRLWPGLSRRITMVVLAWSMPAALMILFGQDTPLWLLFFAAGLVLLEKRRPVAAGISFSLCICKFHLALGIPVLLIAQRRWRALAAGAVSLLLWIAACFLLEGPTWPARYAAMAKLTGFAPSNDVMPTISALTARLQWPAVSELVVSVTVLALLWIACRRSNKLSFAGSAAAACGLLVAHHALYADLALLIPLGVLVMQQDRPQWLKVWAGLVLSPLPLLISMALKQPLVWQSLILPFVITVILFEIAPRTHKAFENTASAVDLRQRITA